jgi:hypothetical protein
MPPRPWSHPVRPVSFTVRTMRSPVGASPRPASRPDGPDLALVGECFHLGLSARHGWRLFELPLSIRSLSQSARAPQPFRHGGLCFQVYRPLRGQTHFLRTRSPTIYIVDELTKAPLPSVLIEIISIPPRVAARLLHSRVAARPRVGNQAQASVFRRPSLAISGQCLACHQLKT